MNPIERENKYQIPMIVHVSSYNYIQSLLNYISINGKNIALEKFKIKKISFSDHIKIYDGLPTSKKLEILYLKKKLPKKLFNKIIETQTIKA